MENKRVNLVSIAVLFFFVAVTFTLVMSFNARRMNDLNNMIYISKIINVKNAKIRMLYGQLMVKERENGDLKKTLQETRNALEALSRKLGTSTPPAPLPAAAPAPVAVPAK